MASLHRKESIQCAWESAEHSATVLVLLLQARFLNAAGKQGCYSCLLRASSTHPCCFESAKHLICH